jgi:hypothetical protein
VTVHTIPNKERTEVRTLPSDCVMVRWLHRLRGLSITLGIGSDMSGDDVYLIFFKEI